MNRPTLVLAVFLFALLPSTGLLSAPPEQTEPKAQESEEATEEATEEDTEEQPMSVWMEKKLIHSQALLRGLAMGDLESVDYNAGRLKMLNRVEGFVRRANPDYRAHLNIFSRVSAEIQRQAKKGNIEGATLAFNQLTVSCVQCHKTLRAEEASFRVDKSPTGVASPARDSNND